MAVSALDDAARADHRMVDEHGISSRHAPRRRRPRAHGLLRRAPERQGGARRARCGPALAVVAHAVSRAARNHGSPLGGCGAPRDERRRGAGQGAPGRAFAMKPARRYEPYLLLGPTLLLLALFFLFPFFLAARQSLFSWDLLTPPTYVGFSNYQVLWERGELVRAFRNTLAYSAVVVSGALLLGLSLALLLD